MEVQIMKKTKVTSPRSYAVDSTKTAQCLTKRNVIALEKHSSTIIFKGRYDITYEKSYKV